MNKKGLVVLLVVVVLVIFSKMCGTQIGDEVTVNRDCFGASTKAAFKEMVRSATSGDQMGILDMMYSRDVRQIARGTRGKIIEDGGTCYRVRLNDDNGSWWISTDYVD